MCMKQCINSGSDVDCGRGGGKRGRINLKWARGWAEEGEVRSSGKVAADETMTQQQRQNANENHNQNAKENVEPRRAKKKKSATAAS